MKNRQGEVLDIIIAHSTNYISEITNDEILSEMNPSYSEAALCNTFNSLEKDGCIKITRKRLKNPINGHLMGQYRKIEILNPIIPKHIKKPYVTKGVNDIATTHPDVLYWLVNKEDGYKYSYGCEAYVSVKCHVCGFEKKVMVCELCNSGFNCPYCSDKISYPNKYIRAFLRQLPIKNMIVEYKDDWTQGRWFDNYFEYNEKKYVVEVDGGQHDRNTQWTTHEYQLNNDNLKDRLAEENGYVMIRLKCGRSRNYKIKETLLKSQFNELFDLTKIDWELCGRKASSNIMFEVCEYYNAHPNATHTEISAYFNICFESITTYLKRGTSLGLCAYDGESKRINNSRNNRKRKYNLYIFYDNNHNEIGRYRFLTEAVSGLNKKYNNDFNCDGIKVAFKRHGDITPYKQYVIERRNNVTSVS